MDFEYEAAGQAVSSLVEDVLQFLLVIVVFIVNHGIIAAAVVVVAVATGLLVFFAVE